MQLYSVCTSGFQLIRPNPKRFGFFLPLISEVIAFPQKLIEDFHSFIEEEKLLVE